MEQNNKGLLYGMGGWAQLFFFIFLAFSGLIFTTLIISLSGHLGELNQSVKITRMALTVQASFFFIIPSLVFAFLSQSNTKEYLKIDESYNVTFLLLGVCLMVVIQPLINFIGYYNQQIVLPESMSAIQTWMKENELAAEKTTGLLFLDKSMAGLILNLLIIAVVAGLGEELFFRGCLQQIIQKIVKNQHFAVWIAAIVFSAMHFQFYGFIPRVLLGAVLGYMFVWSGTIWVPVVVHTVNNVIGVVLAFVYYGTPQYEDLSVYSLEKNMWITILSLIFTVILIIFMYKKRYKTPENAELR